MIEQVLALCFGFVAVTQEELEKVEETQKFELLNCTLRAR